MEMVFGTMLCKKNGEGHICSVRTGAILVSSAEVQLIPSMGISTRQTRTDHAPGPGKSDTTKSKW